MHIADTAHDIWPSYVLPMNFQADFGMFLWMRIHVLDTLHYTLSVYLTFPDNYWSRNLQPSDYEAILARALTQATPRP